MKFKDFLKDEKGLLVFNFAFLTFTILTILLSPIDKSLLSTCMYILIINIVFLTTHLSISYFKKTKFLNTLRNDINSNDFKSVGFLKPSNEEKIYIDLIKVYMEKCEDIIYENSTKFENNKEIMSIWVHDIKMPISIIKLIIEQNQDTFCEHTLDEIDNELMRIENAVERVLYFSKLENFHKDFLVQDVNIEKLVREVIRKYSKYFITNKINLSLNNLNYNILSDKKWLIFIFDQLIGNALKYTSINDAISIYTEVDKYYIKLHIKDTGCGIKKEDVNRIFDKGFTGNNGRNNAKSTGLGLYLVQELCNSLDHKIEVHSIYTEFTEFIVYFNKNYY